MPATTNSLVAKVKRFAVPAGILATLLFALAFLIDHNRVHAAAAPPARSTTRAFRRWSRSTMLSKPSLPASRLPSSTSLSRRAFHPASKAMARAKVITAASAARASAESTRRTSRPDSASSSSVLTGKATVAVRTGA